MIVGQGDNYDETLTDVKSAIAFHIETFGQDIILAHIGKSVERNRGSGF